MPNAVHSFFAEILPASMVSAMNSSSPTSRSRLRKAKDSSTVHVSIGSETSQAFQN